MWYHYDITFVLGCQEVFGEMLQKAKTPRAKIRARGDFYELQFF
jgi:hypothetical protein